MQKVKAPLARCLDIVHFVIIRASNYLSTTNAVPIPPPIHNVARPYLESLFIIS